ncbi:hypothetical protein E2562_006212 [Oryza meyeriana var. granulata]|uniref:Uncharacterized protein n=1 Tax=Oryza meyeriana var. granulata TaxID=110450 RepID=A0A6G1CNL2_9ORYZ|nr:hypothetical protein E2562_006212 [Oryza meyeriana var. granulata]
MVAWTNDVDEAQPAVPGHLHPDRDEAVVRRKWKRKQDAAHSARRALTEAALAAEQVPSADAAGREDHLEGEERAGGENVLGQRAPQGPRHRAPPPCPHCGVERGEHAVDMRLRGKRRARISHASGVVVHGFLVSEHVRFCRNVRSEKVEKVDDFEFKCHAFHCSR